MRSLVVCSTCKFNADEKFSPDGRTGGELLRGQIERVLAERQRTDLKVVAQECLWSCKRHCAVWMRDSARLSYLAGDFEPSREAAEAIIDWFTLHGESDEGTVRFRQWPDGMRGHFIARMPAETMPEEPV